MRTDPQRTTRTEAYPRAPGAFHSHGQEVTLKRFQRIDTKTGELQPMSTKLEH